MTIMITEALAEIKTIGKRIASKQQFIAGYLARQDGIKDPLEKDGGSQTVIARELQAIGDLNTRIIAMRRGIRLANEATQVQIEGAQRSIADWLIWRREIAPTQKAMLADIRGKVAGVRENAKRQSFNVVTPGNTPAQPTDLVININEGQLAKDAEDIENILGQLDGQLSLKNATTPIIET